MNSVQTLGNAVKAKGTLIATSTIATVLAFASEAQAAGFESSVKSSGGQVYTILAVIALVVGSVSLIAGFVMFNSGSAEGMQAGKKRIMMGCLGIGGVLLVGVLIGWVYSMAVQSGGATSLTMPW